MKPFLLLQSRPEDAASNNEYQAFLRFGNLQEKQLKRIRMEQVGVPEIDLHEYSGIIIGGGPSNVSDLEEKKSPAQKKFEPQLMQLLDHVIREDFPLLGACYGIGVIGTHQGGKISRIYGEPVGPTSIELTLEGGQDPLLASIPRSFEAFVGHKEACELLPAHATLLATSENCPVQMFKIKNNIYVTQFHPELDAEGLALRINIYRHEGYFAPEDAAKLIMRGNAAHVTEPQKILRNFVKRFATN